MCRFSVYLATERDGGYRRFIHPSKPLHLNKGLLPSYDLITIYRQLHLEKLFRLFIKRPR